MARSRASAARSATACAQPVGAECSSQEIRLIELHCPAAIHCADPSRLLIGRAAAAASSAARVCCCSERSPISERVPDATITRGCESPRRPFVGDRSDARRPSGVECRSLARRSRGGRRRVRRVCLWRAEARLPVALSVCVPRCRPGCQAACTPHAFAKSVAGERNCAS